MEKKRHGVNSEKMWWRERQNDGDRACVTGRDRKKGGDSYGVTWRQREVGGTERRGEMKRTRWEWGTTERGREGVKSKPRQRGDSWRREIEGGKKTERGEGRG